MTMPSPDGQRIPPRMGAAAYQTYQIIAPRSTHWRPATCEEVDCAAYLNGFRSTFDEATELGQRQAHYIRHDKSRRHVEERTPEGLTAFTFEPGQRCFKAAEHQVRLDKPERFFRRFGDWRGNPTGQRPYEHTAAEFWTEDFAEHQQRISDQIEEG
jgi:hypothetical protein